jgi:PAS domain S-box-containing protein
MEDGPKIKNFASEQLQDVTDAEVLDLAESATKYRRLTEAWRDLSAQYAAIIEAFDGLIYICSQNYEIEFMNQAFIRHTGRYPLGQKCYKALHDRDDICPWCTNHLVFQGQTVRLDFFNGKRHRWYHIINTPIKYPNGTMSKMALIQDITDRKELEEELRRLKGQALETLQKREAILEALGHSAEILLATTSWEDNIQEVLIRLGEAAQVSRVCMFRNQAERDGIFITSQHYEWAAPGISPHLDNPELQNFPLESNGFSRWVKTMRKGRPIFGLVKDFPEGEQRILFDHDIVSIMVKPIFVAGKWWGFIGFDDCTAERQWSPPEIGALKIGADILGAAIQHQHKEEALRRIEWLLTKPVISGRAKPAVQPQPYGNLMDLNTCRVILDAVGVEAMENIVLDYIDLLGSSIAIYEKNGDYAYGILSSGWCRFLDLASRNLCGTASNREALASGQWHCHESCWTEASKICVEKAQSVDIECRGGIRIYALPIRAQGEIIGSLNFGYGDPPQETKKLQEIAHRYGVTINELRDQINSLDSRPAFVIQIAKNRLASLANLIGTIVERKEAEEKVKKSQARLAEAERIAHLGYWEWDIPTDKTFWSDEKYRIFQLKPQEFEATYEAFLKCVHPEDREYVDQSIAESLASGKPCSIDYRFIPADGSVRICHSHSEVLFDAAGQPIRLLGTIQDITAARHAEQALRESERNMRHLASQLMTAQETERQRVSLELHDELGQSLQVLKLMIAEGMSKIEKDQKDLYVHCQGLQNYLKGIIENVRRLSHELSPAILEDLGLSASIKFLLSTLCQHYGIETFRHRLYNLDLCFSPRQQLQIYRIFQESLNNIGKHAKARQVEVSVTRRKNTASFSIRDDGQGFDVQKVLSQRSPANGLGLLALHERIRILGGTLDIASETGKGTRISFEIPIKEEAKSIGREP